MTAVATTELHVFCELYSCLVDVEELKKHKLTGIILSGGPNSVYDAGAPHIQPGVWKLIEELKLPVLGTLHYLIYLVLLPRLACLWYTKAVMLTIYWDALSRFST